jgi:hypothetical protein
MKNVKTALIIALHFALAGILYAATTEPSNTLAPEDTKVASAEYPEQNAFICLYKQGGEVALNGRTYTLQGETTVDKYGAAELIESPTGNAVTILPDGSADIYLNGHSYRFNPE